MIYILPIFGQFFIKLPFKTGINECETPRYGFYWHASAFWFCWGKKVDCIYAPWSFNWHRTSALTKDEKWVSEFKGNHLSFYRDEWKSILWHEDYSYRYILKNGTIQDRVATVRVDEREWRRRILRWTPFLAKISKTIEVSFSDEVGEKTGSWKGGCTGCGYEMLPNEKPINTLRRMEKERKF